MEIEATPDTAASPVINVENLITDGKNKQLVTCVRCSSKILAPFVGEYKEIEFLLPLMAIRKDRSKDDVEHEILRQYWLVKDKFAFENVGFTNTVSGLKYLICADCELGPIGRYDPTTNFCYVSLARVNHKL